jgi:hypothetical protein
MKTERNGFKLIYAGIGHRDAPAYVLNTFEKIGSLLAFNGFVLRSGGARGSDSAFERGCDKYNGLKEIYLPYKGFNGNDSPLYNIKLDRDALNIASKYHYRWDVLSNVTKLLIGRNTYQILGEDLKTPADFVVCYTSTASSGTEQALRIARSYNIPIFNIGNNFLWPKDKKEKFIDELIKTYHLNEIGDEENAV